MTSSSGESYEENSLGKRWEARRGTFRHGSLEEVTVQLRPEGFKGAAVEEQGAACCRQKKDQVQRPWGEISLEGLRNRERQHVHRVTRGW